MPDSPGVYLMKDSCGKIIYIGKAKSLKKRVQSYFSRQLDSKTQAMVARIAEITVIPTPSEAQAQILEASLIKDNQPQYNFDLKDDKSFPWVRISDERFPVVSICRRKKIEDKDKARYFGPYTNAKLLHQAMKLIRRILGFRSCRKMPGEICLFGRINLCPAPCIGKISREDYSDIIEDIVLILEGKSESLIRKLSAQMAEKSKQRDFEGAARRRDQINALGSLSAAGVSAGSNAELEELRSRLGLSKLPLRIEAIDISNIFGKEATGSLVNFYRGLPDKDNYRRFRIKGVSGIDDYGMVKEVVRRRYSRLFQENLPFPDLVIIDGGKGHLLAAAEELKALGIDIALASIAKEKENIYVLNKPRPLRFKEGSPALNLFRRIRDEAHRFAISYHRVLRRKKLIGR